MRQKSRGRSASQRPTCNTGDKQGAVIQRINNASPRQDASPWPAGHRHSGQPGSGQPPQKAVGVCVMRSAQGLTLSHAVAV